MRAQDPRLTGANIQNRANAIIGLMGFALTPDVTTGTLSINSANSDSAEIGMTTLGGGFTLSKSFPLYMEGTAGYSRYDPVFLASDGTGDRPIPTKWNNISVTTGFGWDFPVIENMVFRPMLNLSFGRVVSDSDVAAAFVQWQTDQELSFLANGTLEVHGLGGTLMLDYELVRPGYEVDAELRYTDIHLKSTGDSSPAVQGSSDAVTLSLWSRLRVPTGMTALGRPVRYVFEFARTDYFADLKGALGFDALNSLGLGLELDSSAYKVIVTRTRLVCRYKFGQNVQGYSVGLAISF